MGKGDTQIYWVGNLGVLTLAFVTNPINQDVPSARCAVVRGGQGNGVELS